MVTRRFFLKSSTASAALLLSGCTVPTSVQIPGLPPHAIDMHAHIFNGRDIPVTGFLQQIMLRDTHEPVEDLPEVGLVNLAKKILLPRAPTAREELDEILSETVPRVRTASELLEQDKRNIIAGIAELQAETLAKRLRSRSAVSVNDQNEAILERLYSLTDPAPNSANKRSVARITGRPALSPEEIAERIYDPDRTAQRQRARRRKTTRSSGNVSSGSLEQTMRWAGIMTRSRRDVLAELIRLYGAADHIEIFSPSFVDFGYWLQADEAPFEPSPIQDQIDVMSAIAQRQQDVILLNFVPFCPLRAALVRRDGQDPFAMYDDALTKGYAGVKLYPPAGFRPTGNASVAGLFGAKPGDQVSGAEIDRSLDDLYAWCVAHDLPIKAHGNDSIAAQQCSGAYASPSFWSTVMTRHPQLRVNIAHFGGFEESHATSQNCPPQTDPRAWESIAANMIADGQNAYVDIGFWTDVTRSGTGQRLNPDDIRSVQGDHILSDVRGLLTAVPGLQERLLYGSDWSMIGRIEGHSHYLSDVKVALEDLGLPLQKVMYDNAVTYLGLDRDGPQRQRLRTFFAGHQKFSNLFGVA